MANSPQLARFTLNVGVTGHRVLNLSSSGEILLTSIISGILAHISMTGRQIHAELKGIFSSHFSESPFYSSPTFRIISPMAEGADRLVTKEALLLGYELQSPLPFLREEYIKDFQAEESKDEFNQLLFKATAVLELDGKRDNAGVAYFDVGNVVLNQSDILIAIWDESWPKGRGGTGQIVEVAEASGLPVIRINPNEPFDVKLIRKDVEEDSNWKEGVSSYLEQVFAITTECKSHTADSGYENIGRRFLRVANPFAGKCSKPASTFSSLVTYLKETQPNTNLFGSLYTAVMKHRFYYICCNYLETTRVDWENSRKELRTPYINQSDAALMDHFAWPDNHSIYYANLYRSSFMARFLLMFLAASSVAIGFYVSWTGFIFQLIFLYLTIFLIRLSDDKGWHQRYLDYRLIAELVRQMRFLAPIGYAIPCVYYPAYNSSAQNSWVNLLLRGIVRDAGLQNARFDKKFLNDYHKFLQSGLVQDQMLFHRSTAIFNNWFVGYCDSLSMLFFKAGIVIIAFRISLYFLQQYYPDLLYLKDILNAACMLMPLGASTLAGIKSQGEFGRMAQRSAALEQELDHYNKELSKDGLSTGELQIIAKSVTDMIIGEVLDWRLVVKAKSLSLPI